MMKWAAWAALGTKVRALHGINEDKGIWTAKYGGKDWIARRVPKISIAKTRPLLVPVETA